MKRRLPILFILSPISLLGGCFDQPLSNNFGATTPLSGRTTEDKTTLGDAVSPVRIGELGPNFAACNAQGRVRSQAAGGLPVHAAPFDRAQQKANLAPGATFFICSRSLDQRWFGIVYEAPGRAAPACGVSTPVGSRRDYDGPCDSGWVGSAQVQLISGIEQAPGQSSGNSAKTK
jgi:hypothetical protein